MGFNTGDRILETTTTTGTGNITLAGAVTGYRAFSTVITANGDQFPYVIAGASEWECGIGTRVSSTTFSRVPTASSNAGALVNFSAGTKEVWIDWTHAFINSMRADNIVINGGMEVDQANVGTQFNVTNNADTYGPDCFLIYENGASLVMVGQQIAPPGSPSFGGAFSKCFQAKATTGAALGASELAVITTKIEGFRAGKLGFGASGAQNASVGFWVYATITGTATVVIQNNDQSRTYLSSFSINSANTWEYKTVTVPGDTTGNWLKTNGIGLLLTFNFGCGSSLQGTNNSWQASNVFGTSSSTNFFASTNNVVAITGVSLISGSVPVSEAQSSYVVRSFDEELFLCRRYYQKSFNYDVAPAQNAGINLGEFGFTAVKAGAVAMRGAKIKCVPPMRADGTRTYFNPSAANGQVRDIDASADCSGTATTTADYDGFLMSFTGNASTAVGNLMAVHWVRDSRL